MPFMGVLISWLILAKNADFKRSLSSAFSLAAIKSSSIFLRFEMFRVTPKKYLKESLSYIGLITTSVQIVDPFLCFCNSSMVCGSILILLLMLVIA
ncbi:MAG: hypothetical protein FADNKDHG_01455 [Holosporales bacterium]